VTARIGLVLAFATSVAVLIVPSATAGTLDQSQPGIRTASTSVSNFYLPAQTFTSGLTGGLDQVDLAVGRSGSSITTPLLVEIRSVSGGLPTGPAIATTSVPAASVPDAIFPTAFFSITFPSPAPVTAGVQYAIVVTSAACGFANCYNLAVGPAGDPYPGGAGWLSSDSGATWSPLTAFGSTDFPFKTYVVTGPSSKQQCKKGGWKQFKNPSFKNQGQCVKWFNHHGKTKGKGGSGGNGNGKHKGGKKK
jgi:hypothetical protein